MKNKLEPISIQMELMRISAKRSVIVVSEQIFEIKQNKTKKSINKMTYALKEDFKEIKLS